MSDEYLTAKQWQQHVLKAREDLMRKRKRIWPEGTTGVCPVCHKEALEGRSDLTREVDTTGAVLVFANLHGAVCGHCGSELLEPYEQLAVEERAGTAFRGPVTGSITLLGGKKLGTYWPKDVTSVMNMHARDALEITPLAEDTAVIRIVHRHP